jgi:RNA polymerase primary sigma factor
LSLPARDFLCFLSNLVETVAEKEQEETRDSPGGGSLAGTLKKLLAKGKERGFITYDEMNKALPAEEFSSEQIEDAMAAISDMGIQIVESEGEGEAESGEEEASGKAGGDYEAGGNIDDSDVGRTDDPVRMYLREMGSVELLSREGEIAIAKRIEAGRDMMIGGIGESPLTHRIHRRVARQAQKPANCCCATSLISTPA